MKRRSKPEPEPTPPAEAPAPAPAPKVEDVKVDAALAATGTETFYDGKGLFEPKAEKPGEKTEPGGMSPHLLTYPFIAIFDLAAKIRQYDGWKLNEDEKEYFNTLSAYLLKRFSKVEDLDLYVAIAGIAAMMVKKGVEDIDYHKVNPMVRAEKAVTNPASPTERKGPRK